MILAFSAGKIRIAPKLDEWVITLFEVIHKHIERT